METSIIHFFYLIINFIAEKNFRTMPSIIEIVSRFRIWFSSMMQNIQEKISDPVMRFRTAIQK